MDRLKRLDKRVYVILVIVIILLVLLVSLIIKKTYSISDTTSLADVNITENITFSDVKISTTDSVFKYSGYLISNKDISDVNYINIIPEDEAGNTLATLVDYIGVDIIAGVKKEISASTNKVVLTSMHDIRYEIVKNDGSVIKVSETSLASTTTTTTTNTTTTNTLCDGKVYEFDYTGAEQTFSPDCDGYYELETWGAQGGNVSGYNVIAGYGGYSIGIVKMVKGTNYFINVGGQGKTSTTPLTTINTSYNGGGAGRTTDTYGTNAFGGGGGATHIASVSGILSSLSSNTKDILIVSGGGGGMSYYRNTDSYYHYGSGGSGGGYIGQSSYNYYSSTQVNRSATGGSQTSGGNGGYLAISGSFGQGASYTTNYYDGYSGGGAGFYGGSSSFLQGSGGGSGYIGNSLLVSSSDVSKHMTCYNCTTSNDESTKTISTTNVSSTATSDYAKSGNGYARITFIGESIN